MKFTKAGIVAAFVVCIAAAASAQIVAPVNDVRALLAVRSLKCTFPWYASADWNEDAPKVKNATQEFGFNIDSIDYPKGSARMIGNAGAEDLVAASGEATVSFIEQVPVGSFNITTVYAWRNKAGHFKAVHSRNTAIGGPSPSQNYGSSSPGSALTSRGMLRPARGGVSGARPTARGRGRAAPHRRVGVAAVGRPRCAPPEACHHVAPAA